MDVKSLQMLDSVVLTHAGWSNGIKLHCGYGFEGITSKDNALHIEYSRSPWQIIRIEKKLWLITRILGQACVDIHDQSMKSINH